MVDDLHTEGNMWGTRSRGFESNVLLAQRDMLL